MEKRFLVLQGNMNSCGDGQLDVFSSFNVFDEAYNFMEKIHGDVKGYNKYPNGYLLTQVVDNEKDPLTDDYIIDEIKYYY